MPLIRALLLAAALGLLAGSCGGSAPPPGAIVMVSGRDDHGLVLQAAIGLARAPGETSYPASVADGTFARVIEQRSEWLKVRAVGSDQEGWVNDHYLRHLAIGLQPARQVRFLDAEVREGMVMILVRARDESSGEGTWVPASSLKEIGAAR